MVATESSTTQTDLVAVFDRQRAHSQKLRLAPVKERKAVLRALRNYILSHQPQLEQAVFNDFRKPAQEVAISEVVPVIGEIEGALANLDRWTKPTLIDAPLTYLGTRSEIRYEPKGVCLIIAPWNYPFNLCMGPLASCLAAGNTAIIKPSELTPHTSAFIRQLVADVFAPEFVTVVEGDADVSSALLKLPFDHIFFTGSPAVGKIVMKAAAENLTSVTLELGGKSPGVVDETANLADAARRIAFGKLLNNGQTCIAPDYLLVHHSVAQDLVSRLKKEMVTMFGDGQAVTEHSADYARIINSRHTERIHQLLADAVQRGAQVEPLGAANASTRFIPPTLVTDLPADARLLQEEIFGPVLPIVTFRTLQDAEREILSKPKPLGMYIFSRTKANINRLLAATSAGAVVVNDTVLQYTHPHLPFGGVNNSGIGKAHGHYGFLAFSNEKPVIRQKSGQTATYALFPPYRPFQKKIVTAILRWFL